MQIPSDQLDKIIKLLMLSSSTNDHEALLAVRKVNSILSQNKIKDWGDLFDSITRVETRYIDRVVEKIVYKETSLPKNKKHKQTHGLSDCEIEDLFQELKWADYSSDFIDSLYAQWQSKGILSEKQVECLVKIHGDNADT